MCAGMSLNYKKLGLLVHWNWRYSWLCNANSDEVAGYWEQWDYQASRLASSRSDDPSNLLDEQRRRLDELVQELEEVSRQQLEHVSRLYKPADRSNRRRLAWHQFGF